jgi:drug/metabolite transporter superfamily protein YnfA
MLSSATLYLFIAAALLFGAGAFAAKRILRQLSGKQMAIIAFVTVATLAVIWGFLAFATKKREKVELLPDINEPTPALQPTPD